MVPGLPENLYGEERGEVKYGKDTEIQIPVPVSSKVFSLYSQPIKNRFLSTAGSCGMDINTHQSTGHRIDHCLAAVTLNGFQNEFSKSGYITQSYHMYLLY